MNTLPSRFAAMRTTVQMLSELAVTEPTSFMALVERVKQLRGG